eukprot:scaffold109046_cov54-Phaeocystis_antarctica.AAC.1
MFTVMGATSSADAPTACGWGASSDTATGGGAVTSCFAVSIAHGSTFALSGAISLTFAATLALRAAAFILAALALACSSTTSCLAALSGSVATWSATCVVFVTLSPAAALSSSAATAQRSISGQRRPRSSENFDCLFWIACRYALTRRRASLDLVGNWGSMSERALPREGRTDLNWASGFKLWERKFQKAAGRTV